LFIIHIREFNAKITIYYRFRLLYDTIKVRGVKKKIYLCENLMVTGRSNKGVGGNDGLGSGQNGIPVSKFEVVMSGDVSEERRVISHVFAY
jgi:hypothetical protein